MGVTEGGWFCHLLLVKYTCSAIINSGSSEAVGAWLQSVASPHLAKCRGVLSFSVSCLLLKEKRRDLKLLVVLWVFTIVRSYL